MISKQGRFIFFHIPRTGGSAVQDCLWGGRTEDKAGSHPVTTPIILGRMIGTCMDLIKSATKKYIIMK